MCALGDPFTELRVENRSAEITYIHAATYIKLRPLPHLTHSYFTLFMYILRICAAAVLLCLKNAAHYATIRIFAIGWVLPKVCVYWYSLLTTQADYLGVIADIGGLVCGVGSRRWKILSFFLSFFPCHTHDANGCHSLLFWCR